MTCIVLAAGYATRLYPLTENFPKALLDVSGKTILDRLLDDVNTLDEITQHIVVSNHKYIEHFQNWAEGTPFSVTVLDNGTTTNETRLGAVKDLWFAVGQLEQEDDLLVLAGDNLLDFTLAGFLSYAKKKKTSCIMRYHEKYMENLKKGGVLSVDENDRVTEMHEKPEYPKSNWRAPPFYILTRDDAKRIPKAIADGCEIDAPGSFIAWLSKHTNIHAMQMPGERFDIGDIRSYMQIQSTGAINRHRNHTC